MQIKYLYNDKPAFLKPVSPSYLRLSLENTPPSKSVSHNYKLDTTQLLNMT